MIHSAPLVLPMSGPPVADGTVTVADGRIVRVGRGRGDVHWDGVLVAGLVNAHTHLQYTGMAEVGRRVYDSFEEWSHTFDRAYFGGGPGSWDPLTRKGVWDWAAGAREGIAQSLRYGTTAVADIVTDLEALVGSPLGGVTYLETLGDSDQTWREAGRAHFLRLLEGLDGRTGVSPHAPYTLDSGVIADVAALARDRGRRLHVHLAESANEREYTLRGTGPLADLARSYEFDFSILRDGGTGLAPVAYLDSLGVLGPDCHIAHGVDLGPEDRALLRARGTAVALCPRSNRTLGLPGPGVAALLAEGNRIAVGTDSLSSSPSLDLLADVAALRELALGQGYQGADLDRRLVEAATLGGAAALGLDGEIGCLRPGSRADFAVFDLEPDGREPYRRLVGQGPGRCVATVIGGEVVWVLGSAVVQC
ncbi:amidohydrolase family protein [Nonomuraea sp. NPDC046570]|uniref:amidohydrolase family protein n=1 Tax=Nonomuraea sp. NPDC046570 TaxID=3155255 RepID=UPI0033E84F41